MEIAAHIAVIEDEGRRFAGAVGRSGLDAVVPACPDWDVRTLVRHVSEIHLWAAAQVTGRATVLWPDGLDDIADWWPSLANFWPEDDALTGYYLETNQNLVAALRQAAPDVDARTFLPAPSPLAMWARRQAHELTIHRIDAEGAAGDVDTISPEVAVDGIDELLLAFAPRVNELPLDQASSMAVQTTDTDDAWIVTMGPDGIDASRSHQPADAILRGTAADLYVALWNRNDDHAITVTGDDSVLPTWREQLRIRWS